MHHNTSLAHRHTCIYAFSFFFVCVCVSGGTYMYKNTFHGLRHKIFFSQQLGCKADFFVPCKDRPVLEKSALMTSRSDSLILCQLATATATDSLLAGKFLKTFTFQTLKKKETEIFFVDTFKNRINSANSLERPSLSDQYYCPAAAENHKV